MEEIKILDKTIDEIMTRYFDSTTFREYTEHEQELIKMGFKEGIEYLYPLYETAIRLNKLYERLEQVKNKEK